MAVFNLIYLFSHFLNTLKPFLVQNSNTITIYYDKQTQEVIRGVFQIKNNQNLAVYTGLFEVTQLSELEELKTRILSFFN